MSGKGLGYTLATLATVAMPAARAISTFHVKRFPPCGIESPSRLFWFISKKNVK